MPKIKSHRGARKRVKITATGKIKVRGVGQRHILTKQKKKNKRKLRQLTVLNKTDGRKIRRLIPTL